MNQDTTGILYHQLPLASYIIISTQIMTGFARFARKKAPAAPTDNSSNSNNTAPPPPPHFQTENDESAPGGAFPSFDAGRPPSSGMPTFDNFTNFGGNGFFAGFGSEADDSLPAFGANETNFGMEAEATNSTSTATMTNVPALNPGAPRGIMSRKPTNHDDNKQSSNGSFDGSEMPAVSQIVPQERASSPTAVDKPRGGISASNHEFGRVGVDSPSKMKGVTQAVAYPGISMFAQKRATQDQTQPMKEAFPNQSRQEPEPTAPNVDKMTKFTEAHNEATVHAERNEVAAFSSATTIVEAHNEGAVHTEGNEVAPSLPSVHTEQSSSPRREENTAASTENVKGMNSPVYPQDLKSVGTKSVDTTNRKSPVSTERIFPGKDDFLHGEERTGDIPPAPTMVPKPPSNTTGKYGTITETVQQPVDDRIFPGQQSAGTIVSNASKQVQKEVNKPLESNLTVRATSHISTTKALFKNSNMRDNRSNQPKKVSPQNSATPLQKIMTTREARDADPIANKKSPPGNMLGFDTEVADIDHALNSVTPEQNTPLQRMKPKDLTTTQLLTNSHQNIATSKVASITPPHSSISTVQTPAGLQQKSFDELCLKFSGDLRDTTDLLESGEEELLELQVELEHGYSLGLRHLSEMTDLLQSLETLDSTADAAIAQYTQTASD